MTGRLAVCFAIATLAGCELVVDDGTRVLESVDAGRDSAPDEVDPPAEAALPDTGGTDVGTGPTCSSMCLSQAASCQQTCAAMLASCLSGCHGNGSPCSGQCTEQDAACDSQCGNQCVSCFMQTMCAGSDACTK